MLRVYLDNVAASGRVLGDLVPDTEMDAVRRIEAAHANGRVKRVTSRQSWREQEKTRDPIKRDTLAAARGEVSVVASDHVVLGFSNIESPSGTTAANPLATDIVDQALFRDLKSVGLDDGDAKHLMYAVVNDCQYFVTLDPDFLNRRDALEARCKPIRILKPSALASELSL